MDQHTSEGQPATGLVAKLACQTLPPASSPRHAAGGGLGLAPSMSMLCSCTCSRASKPTPVSSRHPTANTQPTLWGCFTCSARQQHTQHVPVLVAHSHICTLAHLHTRTFAHSPTCTAPLHTSTPTRTRIHTCTHAHMQLGGRMFFLQTVFPRLLTDPNVRNFLPAGCLFIHCFAAAGQLFPGARLPGAPTAQQLRRGHFSPSCPAAGDLSLFL